MKVTLRERIQGARISLYLDIYHKGDRKKEYLKLYLIPKAKTKRDRELNKKTKELAEAIRAKRQLQLQANIHGFGTPEKLNASLFKYLQLLMDKRENSPGNYGNWDSMIKHLKGFAKPETTFRNVDIKFVQGFKDYLDHLGGNKGERTLSQNSKYSYFNKFKAALKQAFKDGIISENPAIHVSAFKQGEPKREFLTLEELKILSKKECEVPLLKKAFIFSCLTGLRWSDISKLKWIELQHSTENGHYIRYRQKKTKGFETLPIPEQAVNILPEKEDGTELIFEGLNYSAWHNEKLQDWVDNAKILKKITFHCARHTYATLQLTMGTDIFTVSKLLGHKELKTTQVYAKIIDDKKKEATNRLNIDL